MSHFIDDVAAVGKSIPPIGLGSGCLAEDCADIVAKALRVGYRHIDTARNYGTERGIGEAIRASQVSRDDIFVTTKISHEDLAPADLERSTQTSLRTLGLDRVDLLLVHWPPRSIPLRQTMSALANMKRRGLTRHIGVANFNVVLIDEAIRECPESLYAVQAEYHPYLDQSTLIDACRRRGLIFIAYCPLARGRLMDDAVIVDIARARGKSVAQVALRWLVQQDGVVAIPRSCRTDHLAQNFDVFDFTLTHEEMARIDRLKHAQGRITNPAELAPAWDV